MIENKFKLGQKVRVKKEVNHLLTGSWTIASIHFHLNATEVIYTITTDDITKFPKSRTAEESSLELDSNEMPRIKLGMVRRFRWVNQPDFDQIVATNDNPASEHIVTLWDSVEDYRNDKRLWER